MSISDHPMYLNTYPRYKATKVPSCLEVWEISYLHLLMQKSLKLPRRANAEEVMGVLPAYLQEPYWQVGDIIAELASSRRYDMSLRKVKSLVSHAISMIGFIRNEIPEKETNDFTRRFDLLTQRTRQESLESLKAFGITIDLRDSRSITLEYVDNRGWDTGLNVGGS